MQPRILLGPSALTPNAGTTLFLQMWCSKCTNYAAPADPALQTPEQCCSLRSKVTVAGTTLFSHIQCSKPENNVVSSNPAKQILQQRCFFKSKTETAKTILFLLEQHCS